MSTSIAAASNQPNLASFFSTVPSSEHCYATWTKPGAQQYQLLLERVIQSAINLKSAFENLIGELRGST